MDIWMDFNIKYVKNNVIYNENLFSPLFYTNIWYDMKEKEYNNNSVSDTRK